MTQKIEVINSMLSTTGTVQLSAADSTHPEYIRADNILNAMLEEFCSEQMWFNTFTRTFSADVDGRVVVPSDILWVRTTDRSLNYAIRGQYLFDNEGYTDIIGVDAEVEVVTIRNTPLEEMPPAAVQYIRALARHEYFVDRDGDALKSRMYADKLAKQSIKLAELNTKLQNLNFFDGPAAAGFYTRRYPSTSSRLPIR